MGKWVLINEDAYNSRTGIPVNPGQSYGDKEIDCIPPPKAVCPELLIGFKSMPYVMRYSNFSH